MRNQSKIIYQLPPDSPRQLSGRLFSGSQLQRVAVKKKSGRTLLQMTPNATLGRGIPRVFRPALGAYLLAGSTVLRLLGLRLELEVWDE
jgi:hypothetical protein